MMDLSRHFFDKNYILATIDRLAMHKMNVLHLHLVDDQGWRIEIKSWPNLAEHGGRSAVGGGPGGGGGAARRAGGGSGQPGRFGPAADGEL